MARQKRTFAAPKKLKATDGRLRKNRQKRLALSSIEKEPLAPALKADGFDTLAQRVADAVLELNQAMQAAAKVQEMRVELFASGEPGQLAYRVYRLTHALYTWEIEADSGQFALKTADKPLASATLTARTATREPARV